MSRCTACYEQVRCVLSAGALRVVSRCAECCGQVRRLLNAGARMKSVKDAPIVVNCSVGNHPSLLQCRPLLSNTHNTVSITSLSHNAGLCSQARTTQYRLPAPHTIPTSGLTHAPRSIDYQPHTQCRPLVSRAHHAVSITSHTLPRLKILYITCNVKLHSHSYVST